MYVIITHTGNFFIRLTVWVFSRKKLWLFMALDTKIIMLLLGLKKVQLTPDNSNLALTRN